MANRPAKNITSLPSQTIVPTDVELGLLMAMGATGAEVADMFLSLLDGTALSSGKSEVLELFCKLFMVRDG